MAVYVIALLAFAIMLYVSFRALAMTPVAEGELAGTLLKVLDEATTQARRSFDAISADAPCEQPDSPSLADRARTARRWADACEKQLGRIEALEDDDSLRQARALMLAAVDDLSWACRMAETAAYGDNPGLQRAVVELSSHGRSCLDAATNELAQRPRK